MMSLAKWIWIAIILKAINTPRSKVIMTPRHNINLFSNFPKKGRGGCYDDMCKRVEPLIVIWTPFVPRILIPMK